MTQFLKFGSARGILSWIRGLVERGHQITVLASHPTRGLGHDPDILHELWSTGTRLELFHSTFDRSDWHEQSLAHRLKWFQKRGYVLQTHGGFAAKAASRAGVEFMHVIHGLGMQRPHWVNEQDRQGIGACSVLVGMSQEALRQARALGVRAPKEKVIPYAVNVCTQPDTPLHKEPEALGIVGELVYLKGHHLLLQALSKSRTSHRLRIIGDGVLREKLSEEVSMLSLKKQVEFTGFLPRHQIYEGLRGLVVPSLRETLGLVALEALQAGVPVLAFPTGGLRELLVEGCGTRFVEPTVQGLSTALKTWDFHYETLRKQIPRGLRHAAELLDPEINIRRMEDCLYDLK